MATIDTAQRARVVQLWEPAKQTECSHDDWMIYHHNNLGNGTCLQCNKEVSLVNLFNGLKVRMEEAIKKNTLGHK